MLLIWEDYSLVATQCISTYIYIVADRIGNVNVTCQLIWSLEQIVLTDGMSDYSSRRHHLHYHLPPRGHRLRCHHHHHSFGPKSIFYNLSLTLGANFTLEASSNKKC